jgi:putative ABC transport system substrate-binding protein
MAKAFLPPLVARAQQATKVYRLAILHPSHPVSDLTESSRFNYYRE